MEEQKSAAVTPTWDMPKDPELITSSFLSTYWYLVTSEGSTAMKKAFQTRVLLMGETACSGTQSPG